jgi:hypothetical protein
MKYMDIYQCGDFMLARDYAEQYDAFMLRESLITSYHLVPEDSGAQGGYVVGRLADDAELEKPLEYVLGHYTSFDDARRALGRHLKRMSYQPEPEPAPEEQPAGASSAQAVVDRDEVLKQRILAAHERFEAREGQK